jgi:hypothetical protein
MQSLQPTSTGDDIEGLVVLLLRDGSKRDAIVLIQEETGASRAEAQRQVAELARRHGISSHNWTAALAVTLAVVGAALIAIAAM